MMVGSVVFAGGLFMFGWTSGKSIPVSCSAVRISPSSLTLVSGYYLALQQR